MRIFFDQATPVPIRPYLERHIVRTAAQQGWDRLKNGDLLTAAEDAGFDVLLTTDKNMRYQQNLKGRKIAFVVEIIMAREGEKARPTIAGPDRNNSAAESCVMRTTPRRPPSEDATYRFPLASKAIP